MSKINLGKIEVLNPLDIWKKEEDDFTPWIAENVEALSDVIGISISIEQIGKQVGGYELDILGKVEGSDKMVVIENQLGPSDHDHLGELITYTAGLEASVAIWITPEVREEHRAAVEWLNNIGGGNVDFYLVRPEIIRIDDSKPAALFRLEAGPSAFIEGIREAAEDKPGDLFRRQFWEELLTYVTEKGHSWAKRRRTSKDPWIRSSVGRSGVGVNVSMAKEERLRVEIYLDHSSREQNVEWYESLVSHKSDIETILEGEQVSWEPLENRKACRVAVYLSYEKKKAETDHEYRHTILFPWISKNVEAMRKIAKRYLVD